MVPKRFIQQKPGPTSVKFAGVYLNLRKMSRDLQCDHGHLSRIFNSKRNPSLDLAILIAKSLNMGIEDFLSALLERERRTALR